MATHTPQSHTSHASRISRAQSAGKERVGPPSQLPVRAFSAKRRITGDQSDLEVSTVRTNVTKDSRTLSPRLARFKIPSRQISDLTVNPVPVETTKGTLCVKKKKMPRVFRLAAVANQVWCVSEDGLRVVAAMNGRDLKTFEGDNVYLSVVGDGMFVFAGTSAGAVLVYNTQTLELVKELQGHGTGAGVYCLLVTPQGIWSGADNGTICLWNSVTQDLKKQFGGAGPIRALAAYKDEIWAGCEDGQVFIFNSTFEKSLPSDEHPPAYCFRAHEQSVTAMINVHNTIWSGSDDRFVSVWDADTRELVKHLIVHRDSVTSLTTVTANKVWSTSADHRVAVWNAKTYEMVGVMPGEFDEVYDVAVVGMYAWIASRDSVVRIFMTQGLVEDAQKILAKFCCGTVSELEAHYTRTLVTNEEQHFLLRTMHSHMIKEGAWYARRNEVPAHVRTTQQHGWIDCVTISLEELSARLKEFVAQWEREREMALQRWDLESMLNDYKGFMRDSSRDPTAQVLRDLRAVMGDLEQLQHDIHVATIELQLGANETGAAHKLSVARQAYTEFNNRITAMIENLEQRVEEGKRRITSSEATIDANSQESESLQPHVQELKAMVKVAQSAFDSANADLKVAQENKAKLDDLAKNFEAIYTALKDSTEKTKQDSTTGQKTIADLKQVVLSKETQLETLKKNIVSHKEQAELARKQQADLNKELADLRRQAKELDEKVKTKCG